MNILSQHHPDDNLLAEFAAGSLPSAQAIAVSAHLHYCPQCRNKVAEFESIGGAILETADIAPEVSTISAEHNQQAFDMLMDRIDNDADGANDTLIPTTTPSPTQMSNHQPKTTTHTSNHNNLPKLVRKIINEYPLKWKRINSSLSSASLVTGQQTFGVSLQKIQAGGIAPEHNHRGAEMTVVLKGSFSDEDGIYHEGDFLLKQSGDIHRPRASRDQDCLCLSVEAAPVKLTSLLGRVLNPFLRLNTI